MTNKVVNRLALVATIVASVVVLLGAWTRLVDAGLGCPDWPGCYGFLTVPSSVEDVATAAMRFPEHEVVTAKGWPEMIHRYFASSLGLFIIGITLLSIRARKLNPNENIPVRHCYGLLLLVICQGLFGMWTVTLKLWPQVVTTHLMGGFTTLCLLFLLYLRTRPKGVGDYTDSIKSVAGMDKLKSLSLLALILVAIQIFLGAWTASNYAALACGADFPTCQSVFWPEMNFSGGFNFFQEVGPNYLGGLFDNESRVAIQMVHRIGALVVFSFVMYLLWRIKIVANELSFKQKVAAKWVLCLLWLQVALGISNVIWLIPLPIAVAHNGIGAALLLSLVNLNFQLRCNDIFHNSVDDSKV